MPTLDSFVNRTGLEEKKSTGRVVCLDHPFNFYGDLLANSVPRGNRTDQLLFRNHKIMVHPLILYPHFPC